MQNKIYLDQFNSNDFEAYFSLVGNEKVMAMITERAIPLTEAKENYHSLLEINNNHPKYGSFKIIDVTTKAFIGLAKLELNINDTTEAELGYMLLPKFWGKGLGSEVCEQLIALAKERAQEDYQAHHKNRFEKDIRDSSSEIDRESYKEHDRNHSKEDHNLKRLTAIIDPNNLASKKILSKYGFVTEFIGNMDGLPAEILAREI